MIQLRDNQTGIIPMNNPYKGGIYKIRPVAANEAVIYD